MRFTELSLTGAYLIDLEPRSDERGFFARLFCVEEMKTHRLESQFIQMNTSHSTAKGTLRGLHYQLTPDQETKVVRCIRGSLFDVILDLRPESASFGKWYGTTLTADNRTMMYVPKGFAHGFLTLEPNTEILYLVSAAYSKENERGVRWNDPCFDIQWPIDPLVISERDQLHHDFSCTPVA